MSVASGMIQRFGRTITLRRPAAPGAFVDGIWQPAAMADTSITASVQPASGDDLLQLPEGNRTADTLKIFTTSELRNENDLTKTDPDILLIDGRQYAVHNVKTWPSGVGDLAHYECLAVRRNGT
jgi:hypothetical protein